MFDTLLIAHSKRFFKETVWKSNYCPAFVCLFIVFTIIMNNIAIAPHISKFIQVNGIK